MESSFSSDEPWRKVCILKGHHKLLPPGQIPFPIMYPNGHSINSKKIADLQKMVPYLPSLPRDFYTLLKDHLVCNDNTNDHVIDYKCLYMDVISRGVRRRVPVVQWLYTLDTQ